MKKVRRWYGWQSLIGVVAGDIMTAFGGGGGLTYIGITAHAMSGPIVHWAHGHTARGFGSLGLQAGLVVGGFLAGYGFVIVTEIREYPALYTVVGMTAAGYVAGPIIDIAALSKETVTVPAEQAKGVRALLPSSVAILPMVDRDKRGLSLVGQF